MTDGELGDNDFRAETFYFGKKGYEWIGWKRNSEHNLLHKLLNSTQIKSLNQSLDSSIASQSLPYVPLAFKFDYIRNFSSVLIHCSNMYTKDVQVFTKAVVQFSFNGVFNNNKHSISKSQLVFEVPNDMHNESARAIKLELENHVARYIRIKLFFASKWLLISEIDFISTPILQSETLAVNASSKVNVAHNEMIQDSKVLDHQESAFNTAEPIQPTKLSLKTTTVYAKTPTTVSQSMISNPLKQYNVIILVISSLILLSLLALIIAVIIFNKQKYKNKSIKLHKYVLHNSLYSFSYRLVSSFFLLKYNSTKAFIH